MNSKLKDKESTNFKVGDKVWDICSGLLKSWKIKNILIGEDDHVYLGYGYNNEEKFDGLYTT